MTPRRLQPTRHAAHTLLTAPDFSGVASRLASANHVVANERGAPAADNATAPAARRADDGLDSPSVSRTSAS